MISFFIGIVDLGLSIFTFIVSFVVDDGKIQRYLTKIAALFLIAAAIAFK